LGRLVLAEVQADAIAPSREQGDRVGVGPEIPRDESAEALLQASV